MSKKDILRIHENLPELHEQVRQLIDPLD